MRENEDSITSVNDMLADWQRELDDHLAERGITEEEWHREIEQEREDAVVEDQKRDPSERMAEFDREKNGDFDSALIKHMASIARWYVQSSLAVLTEDEVQLALDFEQVERDYAHSPDIFDLYTQEEKVAMYERRVEAFRKLGEIVPGMWW